MNTSIEITDNKWHRQARMLIGSVQHGAMRPVTAMGLVAERRTSGSWTSTQCAITLAAIQSTHSWRIAHSMFVNGRRWR